MDIAGIYRCIGIYSKRGRLFMKAKTICIYLVVSWVLFIGTRACDCSNSSVVDEQFEDCVDNDGDGFGEKCQLGADCNDEDPNLTFSCDCETEAYEGCPCNEGDSIECFESTKKEYIGVGICRTGTRSCQEGSFSSCEGMILPASEADYECNKQDDDCDGETDEGNQCQDCGPRCTQVTINDFEVSDESSHGLQENPDGSIQLQEGEDHVELTFLYVANSGEGTVSKINTQTGQEVARYISALCNPDPRNRSNAECSGNAPSRTAVDFNGDVWVANRAFEQQGSVTKIAHQNCRDTNGNDQIETSSDVNQNGIIDLDDPLEFLGEDDECILFTVDVGGINGLPRALALDAGGVDGGRGNAWVGVYNEDKFVKLDALDGEVIGEIPIGLHPYGAAIDSHGILWATQQNTSRITSINTYTYEVGEVIQIGDGCRGSYGIAVDRNNRVWVGGYNYEEACSYDPSTGTSMRIDMGGLGITRGIAADADDFIWVAHCWTTEANIGRITRFKADDGSQLESFYFPETSNETIGVGIDFDGKVWGVNRNTDDACRVDPSNGQVDCFPTGRGTYTYSDFTGYALRNFTAPSGSYFQGFEGCGALSETTWTQVAWEASVPDGTKILVYVKAFNDGQENGAIRHGPYETSPASLVDEDPPVVGENLQVEVVLSTEVDGKSPILKGISAQRVCGGAM
jgi:streptogramin lyase